MAIKSADLDAGGIGRSLTDVRRDTVSENEEACASTIDLIVEASKVLGGWSLAAGRNRSG